MGLGVGMAGEGTLCGKGDQTACVTGELQMNLVGAKHEWREGWERSLERD